MKILLRILLCLALFLGAAFAYLNFRKPAVSPPLTVKVQRTPERLARGKYIALLADCEGCHSPTDSSRFGFPKLADGHFSGYEFTRSMGLPGLVVAPNLTPDIETGIGSWTDGEKIRAIREGVDRDGRALFPMMPYQHFRDMSDEDVYSLVAYLDSLPPIRRAHPANQVDFPVPLMIKSVPKPVEGPVTTPIAPIVGGMASIFLRWPGARVVMARIWPLLTSSRFHQRFKCSRQTSVPIARPASVNGPNSSSWISSRVTGNTWQMGRPCVGPDSFTTMPWLSFAQLPDDDIRAIYAYVHSLPAVKKSIETHPKKGT